MTFNVYFNFIRICRFPQPQPGVQYPPQQYPPQQYPHGVQHSMPPYPMPQPGNYIRYIVSLTIKTRNLKSVRCNFRPYGSNNLLSKNTSHRFRVTSFYSRQHIYTTMQHNYSNQ